MNDQITKKVLALMPAEKRYEYTLDIDDIRATDEFRHKESDVVETADHWNFKEVGLAWSFTPTYAELAANYLRRQHGSNEWKPCTKEVAA